MSAEPHIMCPNCRIAIPDREYYRHAQKHQPPRPALKELPKEDEEK